MSAPAALDVFAESLDPLERCLNPESAAALASLKPDEKVQARVAALAERGNEGQLTAEERAEYNALIWADHFLAILQAKARHFQRYVYFIVQTQRAA